MLFNRNTLKFLYLAFLNKAIYILFPSLLFFKYKKATGSYSSNTQFMLSRIIKSIFSSTIEIRMPSAVAIASLTAGMVIITVVLKRI